MIMLKSIRIFLFLLLCFLFFINCAPQKNKIVDKKMLSLSMSDETIDAYYKILDILLDKEDKEINLGIITDREKRDELLTMYKETEYFENRITFSFYGENMHERGDYILQRSTIRPDGYINFINYRYRENGFIWRDSKSYVQYAEDKINPLKTSPGYIITEKDIPVYEYIYIGEIPNRKQAGHSEIGLIKAGTVIRIDYILIDGSAPISGVPRKQAFINVLDLEIIKQLQESVSYKIKDDRLYRFIDGQQIEINYDKRYSGYNGDGYRYIRNEYFLNWSLNKFYFWEKTGDYLFDNEGNFLKIVEFGPDWSGE